MCEEVGWHRETRRLEAERSTVPEVVGSRAPVWHFVPISTE